MSFKTLSLLGLLAASPVAFGSGGSDECDDMYCASFFAPEVIQNPAESPFFRSYRFYYTEGYDVEADNKNNVRAVNLTEWSAYLGAKFKRPTLAWFLYKMSSDDLAALTKAMEGGGDSSLNKRTRVVKRELESLGDKAKALNVLHYLDFAKKVEPIATRRAGEDGWDEQKRKKDLVGDSAAAEKLVEASSALIAKADSFVAERFRFQVLRLKFYTEQYEEAQKYYEANKDSIHPDSSVKHRFTEVAAGAYYKQKQYGKANYLYSLVFDRSPSQKRSSFFSFHPMNDSDWKETLAMAKSKRETEVLWQLIGVYADGMAAIDHIYKLNPQSNLLPLLLVREVNKAEEDFTANQSLAADSQSRGSSGVKSSKEAVGAARIAAIKAIADAGNTLKPYLWKLSVGHLLALAGESRSAEQYIRAAMREMPKEPVLRTQARLSLYFARVRSVKAITKNAEPYFATELAWLATLREGNPRASNLQLWTLKTLSAVYAAGGDIVRALMLHDSAKDPAYKDPKKVDAILAFKAKPATDFDKYLAKSYPYSTAQLTELKALSALYNGHSGAAVGLLQQAGSEIAGSELNADPFKARISDCHDCDAAEEQSIKYTKLTFAEKLAELAGKAGGSGEAAAEASFLLANGYYNMSYYGNSRVVYETAFGNFSPNFWGRDNKQLTLSNDLAEKAYLRAASLSSSKELQAKAYWGAAKAEQNRFYNNNPEYDGKDIHPGVYYKKLKDGFSDTTYYQEIIKECGYFKTYLGL